MLKAYAVALVLSTSAPVADTKQQGLDKAPEQTKSAQTQVWKPKSGGIRF